MALAWEIMEHLGIWEILKRVNEWPAPVGDMLVGIRLHFNLEHLFKVWQDVAHDGDTFEEVQDAIDTHIESLIHDQWPAWFGHIFLDKPADVARSLNEADKKFARTLHETARKIRNS